MPGPEVRAVDGGIELAVVVSAGSSRSCVRGLLGGALRVAVQAPPERGRANAEVAEVVAGWLGIPARRVRVAGGLTSRRKSVRVDGADSAALVRMAYTRMEGK